MHDDLLRWFRHNARDLPWRRRRSPYRTWISEVMLQQTRVDTVIPYFEAFLDVFPDVETLAAAPLERVLKAWEGLGYYRRARFLHAAALQIAARGGELPGSAAELRALPGFGPYTAAAVASLAFGERVVAVDGNVRRVGARLFALERPSHAAIARRLAPLQPAADSGAFNEALIELGALVCTPRAPACSACPLAARCAARAAGAPEAYPDDPPRTAVPTRRRLGLVHLDRSAAGAPRVWLRQRGADELLPGLWGIPQIDPDTGNEQAGGETAGNETAGNETAGNETAGNEQAGGETAGGETAGNETAGNETAGRMEAGRENEVGARLEPVRHVYSHFRLELIPLRSAEPGAGSVPVEGSRLAELPLSVVDRKVLAAAQRAGWPLPESGAEP